MKKRARELRYFQTQAEAMLWSYLRNRKVAGLKFRRQFPLGPYIADFCCLEKRLIIEIDGDIHEKEIDRDSNRTEALQHQGFRVMRFWNDEVVLDAEGVCEKIKEACCHPLPSGEGPGRESDRGGEAYG